MARCGPSARARPRDPSRARGAGVAARRRCFTGAVVCSRRTARLKAGTTSRRGPPEGDNGASLTRTVARSRARARLHRARPCWTSRASVGGSQEPSRADLCSPPAKIQKAVPSGRHPAGRLASWQSARVEGRCGARRSPLREDSVTARRRSRDSRVRARAPSNIGMGVSFVGHRRWPAGRTWPVSDSGVTRWVTQEIAPDEAVGVARRDVYA